MQAQLWRFRIFRAQDRYQYKSSNRLFAKRNIVVDDSTEVVITIGAIPQDYKAAYSMTDGILEMMLTRAGEPRLSPVPPDWVAQGEVYTCVRVSQVIELQENPQSRGEELFWYDSRDADAKTGAFRERARSITDSVTGRLVGCLGMEILNSMLHESRIFLEADGKPAQPLIELRFGTPHVILMRSVDELNYGALNDFNLGSLTAHNEIESVGRWFAMAVGESDPFKRFIWAFAGLEVLAGKAVRLWRNVVLARLSTNGLLAPEVVKELLWPAEKDKPEDPRSVVFRFAVMATAASHETAKEDIGKFKDIQIFRNRIHGRGHIDERIAEEKALVAMKLLRRYGPAVAKHLGA